MLKSELESKYNIIYREKDKTYTVYDNGYLCSLEKKDQKYRIVGTKKWISNLDDLIVSIDTYIKELEFPSNFYNPEFRDGVFEEHVMVYYLKEFGFEHYGEYWRKKIHNKDHITLSVSSSSDIRENKNIIITKWFNVGKCMPLECGMDIEKVKANIIYASLESLDSIIEESLEMLSKMMTKDQLKEYLDNKLEAIYKED